MNDDIIIIGKDKIQKLLKEMVIGKYKFKCIYCNEPFTNKEFGNNCKRCGYTLLPQEYK